MSKQDILYDLVIISNKLSNLLEEIKIENSDGKQFDFVTSSSLGDVVANIERKVKNIEKIVYQKGN